MALPLGLDGLAQTDDWAFRATAGAHHVKQALADAAQAPRCGARRIRRIRRVDQARD
ncbi:hypothetical protein [Verminephrobacter eiseniae]|uniref:hypothetical protein n=1 Tax=Verminephrobacter eiseniae TaxID=364317 RepID=UPI0022381D73|nr:hypothetical protein [Verminephrobacter eiseniae]